MTRTLGPGARNDVRGHVQGVFGGEQDTGNNCMTMMVVVWALEALKRTYSVVGIRMQSTPKHRGYLDAYTLEPLGSTMGGSNGRT